MKIVKITLALALILIMLMQGCAYLNYQYFKLFKLESNEKNDFVMKLIEQPELFDSLLTNSKYYHKEYSQNLLIKENKLYTIRTLNYFNKLLSTAPDNLDYLNIEPSGNKNKLSNGKIVYLERKWEHDIIYLYDKKNIDIKTNVLEVSFLMVDSKWYLTGIRRGNYQTLLKIY